MNAEPKRFVKRLYSVEEAAAYLGRSEWSVRRLLWNGLLPEVRIGRRVQVDIHDLDSFIEHNKAPIAA
jgi:excisionase family DNA binding protein